MAISIIIGQALGTVHYLTLFMARGEMGGGVLFKYSRIEEWGEVNF